MVISHCVLITPPQEEKPRIHGLECLFCFAANEGIQVSLSRYLLEKFMAT